MATDKETDIMDACGIIALCLKLSCGRQEEQTTQQESGAQKEGYPFDT